MHKFFIIRVTFGNFNQSLWSFIQTTVFMNTIMIFIFSLKKYIYICRYIYASIHAYMCSSWLSSYYLNSHPDNLPDNHRHNQHIDLPHNQQVSLNCTINKYLTHLISFLIFQKIYFDIRNSHLTEISWLILFSTE
jgi:hypothetical protein